MRIPLKSIRAVAKDRKDGYDKEVLKRGVIDGDDIVLSEEDFQYIRREFALNSETPSLPPLKTMAQTALESTAKWIISGAKATDPETLRTRTEICQSCEFWNSKAFGKTGRCMKCGCSTWAKLRMATEKCPIGKW